MRRLALFFALALVAAPAFAQRSDTCRVYMQMYDYTGAPARRVPLQIKRMVLNGVNIVIPPRDAGPSSDDFGVVQFRAIKNATVWLYAQTAGLDSANVTGRPVALSGDAVQWIVPTTAASVPPRYVVSIADLWAGKGVTAGLVDSILFSGAGVSVTKSFGALTVDIPGGGGASVYGDSIHVADSIARAAVTATRMRDSLALRALAVGDSLARHYLRMGDSLSARMAQMQAWVIARGYVTSTALSDSLDRIPRAPFALNNASGVYDASLWNTLSKEMRGLKAGNRITYDTSNTESIQIDVNDAGLVTTTALTDSLNKIPRTGGGGSITDSAHTVGRYTMGADSIATTSIDWQAGNYQGRSISGNIIFTWSNLPTAAKSQFLTVRITATGAYSVGWPASVQWEGAVPAQASNGTTTYSFVYDALWGVVRGFGASDTSSSVRQTHPQIPGLATGDTNIVAGFDSNGNIVPRWDNSGGSGAIGDSLNLRVIVQDSSAVTDSIKWVVGRIRHASYAPGSGYGGNYRLAEVDIDLTLPGMDYRSNICQMTLYSDSANGVDIAGWRWETYNTYSSAYMSSYFAGMCGFTTDASTWQNSFYVAQPSGAKSIYIYGKSLATYKRVKLYATGDASGGGIHGRAKLTVICVLPITASSTWYVRLKSWP